MTGQHLQFAYIATAEVANRDRPSTSFRPVQLATHLLAVHERVQGHGDLHGLNVLVNKQRRAMMIDYGSVGPLPSSMDAVTLELSPFFHPQGVRAALQWKSGDGDIDWFDVNSFSEKTTIPSYIKTTREWAHGEAFGDREVLASAYAYVASQLQFSGTDKDLAWAMAFGIVKRAMAT